MPSTVNIDYNQGQYDLVLRQVCTRAFGFLIVSATAGHYCLRLPAENQYHASLTPSPNRAHWCLMDTPGSQFTWAGQFPDPNQERDLSAARVLNQHDGFTSQEVSMTPQPSRPASSCFSAVTTRTHTTVDVRVFTLISHTLAPCNLSETYICLCSQWIT